MVVSYNDANVRQWVSGEENPTNTAIKQRIEAVIAEARQ
jgi:hypothetical protein